MLKYQIYITIEILNYTLTIDTETLLDAFAFDILHFLDNISVRIKTTFCLFYVSTLSES